MMDQPMELKQNEDVREASIYRIRKTFKVDLSR